MRYKRVIKANNIVSAFHGEEGAREFNDAICDTIRRYQDEGWELEINFQPTSNRLNALILGYVMEKCENE